LPAHLLGNLYFHTTSFWLGSQLDLAPARRCIVIENRLNPDPSSLTIND
jgi:hypothetical protein